jgi:hypothetical protein
MSPPAVSLFASAEQNSSQEQMSGAEETTPYSRKQQALSVLSREEESPSIQSLFSKNLQSERQNAPPYGGRFFL